ncbi:IS3 family transposase [Streptomyces sp. NPDC050516]|uniref:IS3 family transposase n=1 Tax=Streptomyces sp. NPDC050516 TaxID=3365621 RepID=UPI0037A15580
MIRCQFVEDHQRRSGVTRLCSLLGIARSSFYYWRRTAAARATRQAADAELATRIRKAHQDSDGAYGAPRITAELRDEDGLVVNHKRVARIMRAIRIEGVRLRRRHRTTVSDTAAAKFPDLIGRDFTAAEANAKYVGDITYLSVGALRYPALALLCAAVSAVLTGARSLIAISEWITDARSMCWASSASLPIHLLVYGRCPTPQPCAACCSVWTVTRWTRRSARICRPERHPRSSRRRKVGRCDG